MTDIHTHILPGVDDGSGGLEDSLEMAEIAFRSGTRLLAATPHCNLHGYFENYEDSGECGSAFQRFRRALEAEGIPLKVVRGMEIYGVGDLRELIGERRLISLNHTGNYLIEFPFDMHPDDMTTGLRAVFEAGGIPVLAHPERYYCVQDMPGLAERWRKDGVLIQGNMGSFLGAFGRSAERTAEILLARGLLVCLASDSHGIRRRSPDMRKAYDYIRRGVSEEAARRLFEENPRRILTGKPV